MMFFSRFLLLLIFSASCTSFAQLKTPKPTATGVYVDAKGVMRWKKDQREATFFGVNYTLPFAYAYRSHKALKIDHFKAIDQDVYHLARLGINAFRVHIWDTEISDSLGNLKNNEHLRLFDYLVAKLQERGIYTLITPIAFWGNGYPDPDEKTGSFSELYGKEKALVNEKAFKAQERYLTQFFNHVNPYTKKKYGDDPFVIATEINNEPHHTGPKARTTEYINRMRQAILATGWKKPVFYNISESPMYADAVANSKADGFSFQWYPTGLVAGHELKGNFLPNVDRYQIPFDTIPAFAGKPKMVYEFDAADILQSYMYPAMARSFRSAGFQWVTQFAYDPMGTAYANTEYQTHYLNLAYTPSKAISLLIAGKVFRQLPLSKSYGAFPADTLFDAFRLSYTQNLSEMNSNDEFYYTNNTSSLPKEVTALKHIAGVGSSPIVTYSGSGAYFMDKLADGVWRLEVMPDVLRIQDPFEKSSLEREATRVVWNRNQLSIQSGLLGSGYSIKGLNTGNTFSAVAAAQSFTVLPGIYLLQKKGVKDYIVTEKGWAGFIGLREFVAPKQVVKKDLKTIPVQKISKVTESKVLYAADSLRNVTLIHPGEWGTNKYAYMQNGEGKAVLKLDHKTPGKAGLSAIEVYIKDKLNKSALTNFSSANLVLKAKATIPTQLRITLIDKYSASYSATVELNTQTGQTKIPFSSFTKGESLLLPRPYPGFQPLYFKKEGLNTLDWQAVEKMQLSYPVNGNTAFSVWIESVIVEP